MNLFSNIVKASGVLRNIPLCGYMAGAQHMLIGRLQEIRAELLCSARASREEIQEHSGCGTLLLTSPHPIFSPPTLLHNSLPVAASTQLCIC